MYGVKAISNKYVLSGATGQDRAAIFYYAEAYLMAVCLVSWHIEF